MAASRYRRPRIMFGLDQKVKEEIEQWAERDGRTLANLIEQMVLESYHKRKSSATTSTQPTNTEILEDLTASKFLLMMASGLIPSDEEVIEAAREAKLDAHALLALRDRCFPKPRNIRSHNEP